MQGVRRVVTSGDKVVCDDIDKFLGGVKATKGIFAGEAPKCNCNSPNAVGTFATFYLMEKKYVDSFRECDRTSMFPDINVNNTVWLELFQSTIKGFGEYLLYPFIVKLIQHKIKYIMLYPSNSLGSDRNTLLNVYRQNYGFHIFRSCKYPNPEYLPEYLMGRMSLAEARNYRLNPFDGSVPVENMYLVCKVNDMYDALLRRCMSRNRKICKCQVDEASADDASASAASSAGVVARAECTCELKIQCVRCKFLNEYIRETCENCGTRLPPFDEKNNPLGLCLNIVEHEPNKYMFKGGATKYSHIKADYLSLSNY
jgi:hypothetical protein